MRRFLLLFLAIACVCAPTLAGQSPKPAAFPLTVDSIMRGPDLLGAAPRGLRWSGDSTRLYFEWTRPGEDEASTYVVGRDGGEPRKLTDAERQLAPPPGGEWDPRPPARPVRRRGGHRHRGLGGGHAHPGHPDDRAGEQPPVGAERDPRDLRPGRQPVHRADRGGRARARDTAHRHFDEETRAAVDRQPEVPERRGSEADRVHARADREAEEGRGEGGGGRPAPAGAGRRAVGGGPAAVAGRHARLRARQRAGPRREGDQRADTTSPRARTSGRFPAAPTSETRRTSASWPS